MIKTKDNKNFLIQNGSGVFIGGKIPEKVLIMLLFENWDLIDYDYSILELLSEEEANQIKDKMLKELVKIEQKQKEEREYQKIDYENITEKRFIVLLFLLLLNGIFILLSFFF